MDADLLSSIFSSKNPKGPSRRSQEPFTVFYSKYEATDSTEFRSFFGVTRDQFDQIMSVVRTKLTNHCRKRHFRSVPVEVCLAMFLRFKTRPNISMKTIAREFGVGFPTVQVILKQVAESLNLPQVTVDRVESESPPASPKKTDEGPTPSGQFWCKTWTDREREVLIDEIRQRPHLFDINDPMYKAKERRAAAFEAIGVGISRKMGFAEPIEGRYVASQWKILKDTFNRTRRSLSGPRASEHPVWRFYTRMSFLTQTEASSSEMFTSNDSDETPPSTSAVDFFSGTLDSASWSEANIDLQSFLGAASAAIANHTDGSCESDSTAEPSVATSAEVGLEDFIVNVVQRRLLDSKQEEDEFDVFGKLVSTTLRDLTRTDRSLAQKMRSQINEIVHKYGARTSK